VVIPVEDAILQLDVATSMDIDSPEGAKSKVASIDEQIASLRHKITMEDEKFKTWKVIRI
jgi:hypothetical protein